MSELERCPKCGSRLTAGSVEGLCPRCLLTAALCPPAETAPENLPEPGSRRGAPDPDLPALHHEAESVAGGR